MAPDDQCMPVMPSGQRRPRTSPDCNSCFWSERSTCPPRGCWGRSPCGYGVMPGPFLRESFMHATRPNTDAHICAVSFTRYQLLLGIRYGEARGLQRHCTGCCCLC